MKPLCILHHIGRRGFRADSQPITPPRYSKAILWALLALSLSACHEDAPDGATRMDFSVAAADSRAADVYSSSNSSFTSMLVTTKKPDRSLTYFSAAEFVRSSDGWLCSDGDRYWPPFALQFYAVAPAIDGLAALFDDGGADQPQIVDFTVDRDAADQVDLLVAYTEPMEKSEQAVPLLFRHALAQVAFRAYNASPLMHVEVHGLTLANVNSRATFTFPEAGTEPTAVNWSNLSTPTTFPIIWGGDFQSPQPIAEDGTSSLQPIAVKAESTPLTDGYLARTLMLLPQTVAPWTATATSGAYLLVSCAIYNVADPAKGYQPGRDLQIWGVGGQPDEILVPIAIDWQPGMKYVYTLPFGEGGNGINPRNPTQPTLTPLSYTFFPVDPWIEENVDIEI